MGSQVTRRGFLAALGGAAGTAAAAESAVAQEGAATERVNMTDGLVFNPEEIFVEPGTTVIWQNVGAVGHSVTAYEDEIPDAADYFASGGFGGEAAARQGYPSRGDIAGEENYRHTFEVEGTYEYFCIPHESVGMVGTVEVTTDPPAQEGFVSILSNQARDIAIYLVTGLVAVLAFAWAAMKYGGEYGEEN